MSDENPISGQSDSSEVTLSLETDFPEQSTASEASGAPPAVPSEGPANPSFDWSQPPPPAYLHPQYPPQQEGAFDRLIPTRNPNALIAYYLAVFSLIPCAAIFLGTAALILGIKGLKAVRANPNLPGVAHAWIGIILGGLMALANVGFLTFVLMNAKFS